jgi:Zinc knuckle
MIYLPGRMILDFILFALAFHFIKKIGNIHFFWQAVPQINHLYGSYHSPTHPIDIDQLLDQQVTMNYEEMGTQMNPIDVDRYIGQLDTPYPRTNNVQRIHSAPTLGYCSICDQTGHLTEHCLRRVEPCGYCGEIGHYQTECTELQRDVVKFNLGFKRCFICDKPGHTVEQHNQLPFSQ